VKVDVSLVEYGDPSGRPAIVAVTIALAQFRLDIVAEGVENGATLRLLQEMGCDRAQGHFIAYPMPPSQLVRWSHTQLSVAA
jgi:EAL domain-containing protein (putative c-di-GMP-specific phosphodiesterase class I)